MKYFGLCLMKQSLSTSPFERGVRAFFQCLKYFILLPLRYIDIFRFQFWYNSRKSLDRKHSNLKLIAATRIPMHWGRQRGREPTFKTKFPPAELRRVLSDSCFVQLKLGKVDDIYCSLKTHNINTSFNYQVEYKSGLLMEHSRQNK